MNAGATQDYSDPPEDDQVSNARLFINIAGTETILDMGSVELGDDR